MSVSTDSLDVIQEARLIALEAARDGNAVRPLFLARIVADAYPNTSYKRQDIAEMIKRAANLAGVGIADED